jgi:hypothetical protein
MFGRPVKPGCLLAQLTVTPVAQRLTYFSSLRQCRRQFIPNMPVPTVYLRCKEDQDTRADVEYLGSVRDPA